MRQHLNRMHDRRPDDVSARARLLATLALPALVVLPATARGQDSVVAGIVVAEVSQRPLPGAQVVVEGAPGRGAVADASGRFRITGISGTEVTLSARLIGYRSATQSVPVGAREVRFALAERPVELNQVIVTGTAGGLQQRALGNSVGRINAAQVVATAPIPDVQNLINGRAAGVVVMPGTGMVGSGAKIRIRGASTFSLSGEPLIYVDGVRVNNESGTGLAVQAFGSGVVSRLNDFDPEEIESIEILKGPAAATLYGTEAGRGLINIITKQGATEGTRYSFTVKQGANWFMDPEHRVPTNYWRDPNGALQSVNVIRTEDARGTPVFRTGRLTNYEGTVSGGAGRVRYFASAGWGDDGGAEPNNARRQFSARTNVQVTPNARFDLGSSVGYVDSHTSLSCEAGCGGATWGAWFSTPANLAQNCRFFPGADSTCGWARGFNDWPPEVYRAMQDWQDVNRFTGSFTARYRPFPWMTHRLTVGTDFTQEKNEELLGYATNDTVRFFWGQYADGWKYQNRREGVYNTYDYSGTVQLDLTSRLNSASTFGVQYYTRHISSIAVEGDFFPAPGLETVSSTAVRPVTLDSLLDNNTLGFFGQQQFGWENRLFFIAALRVDNNSAFGKDIKWVTYPKASLSWVLNEEPWFRAHAPAFIGTLKVRAAYGQSGQQPDVFTALRTLSPVPGPNGTPALTPGFIGNPSLGPERGREAELGFDAGLWNDRLGVGFTFYDTHTQDAILLRGVAPSTGFGATSQYVNAGEIRNRGVEALVTAQLVGGQAYGWDATLSISHNSGRVVKLSGTDTTIVQGSIQQRIGYPPWSFFRERVVSAEFDPVTRKAVNVMCDDGKGGATPCFNADGRIIAPRVFLGRAVPTLEGSVSSNVRFLQRFRFAAMIDFKTGYKKWDNNLRARCQVFRTCLENMEPEKYDPRLIAQMQSNGTLVDFVVNDASFAKLREVSLSFDVPESYAGRFGARSLVLSVAGRNLHTCPLNRSARVAVAALAAVLAACNSLLDVKVPDRVPAELLDDPKQAGLMVNSAIGDFECALGSSILVEGIISDELADAQLGAAAWPYDRRDANTQPGGIYGVNPCSNNQNPGIYVPLSTARWDADRALTKLEAWTDQQVANRGSLIARAALYAGFSYALMGMSMCEAAFDLSAPIGQQPMFAKAEERFTTAIDAGSAAGLADVVNAAYVGRARVRLYQDELQGAAADAQNVPPGFVLEASAASDNNRRYNRVYAAIVYFGLYTVDPQSRNLTTEGVPDPRAATALMSTRPADSRSTIWAPTKYASLATPLPIARYEEAQLILAEAQGGSAAVGIINSLRDAAGLPHYAGPTDDAAVRQLIVEERRRALFAEGFRNYDIERFNLPLVPAPGTDYPDKGGSYGTTTCLPLPDSERFNNPNAG